MKLRRNDSVLSPTLVLVVVLPVLLGVLATLQYRWLTEISRSERERLQSRLRTDARRFAQDFNAEIAKAYLIFQLDARVWEKENYNAFAERFDLWNANVIFPNTVGEIYFVNEQKSLRFNPSGRNFETVELPAEIGSLRNRLLTQKRDGASSFAFDKSLIDERILSLTVPIFKSEADNSEENQSSSNQTGIKMNSTPEGFVIVKFNRAAINKEVLPEVVRKNFADDAESYDFTVKNKPGEIIFQSAQPVADSSEPDAAAYLFDLSPETTNVVVLNGTSFYSVGGERRAKIIRKRIDSQDAPHIPATSEKRDYHSDELPPTSRAVRKGVIGGETVSYEPASGGLWLLSVRHKEGSLETFVGKTKWRNLGLSFGILALLGASVVLLLISAQRSRRAAQRQFDFVSSVSHEFRTPVAVIRSAGMNLGRGIISNPEQVKKYGDLIDREGSRIAEMVEQILEFAGARSNRNSYDFQSVSVLPLVEQILADFRPLLEQHGFTVEKDFAPDLPSVNANAKSLRQAVENLVGNAVKYSDQSRWLKISAFAEGGYVVISVADKGIGIDAKELKSIFEPFYRGREAIAEQIRGNGLGLNLVERIIAVHNGKVSVESERGKGSVFTIKLPSRSNNGNGSGD